MNHPNRQDDSRKVAVPTRLFDLSGWFRLIRQLVYTRYIMVSAAAMAIDLSLFFLLLSSGSASVVAAALGYSAGIGAHWWLSTRLVFAGRVSRRGSARRTRQKALFLFSALLGLAVTTAIVAVADIAGGDPRIAKLVAIIVAFQMTYMLRNLLIFRQASDKVQ